MAQRTKTAYKALYGTSGTLFPDNTTGEISESDVRAFGEDNADTFLSLSDNFVDEDDMVSNSATKAPSQQSVKAYVDAQVGGVGAVTSVTGTTDRITSTGGATPVIDISAAYDAAITAEIAAAVALRQLLINSATALTDGASMDLTAIKHTLTTSSATRTFTISYTGDDISLVVTLNTTASVFTFPATSLCVSDGIASGDNTCSLAGISGDKYVIAIKKVGSDYYVVSKNFGQ